MSYLKVSSKNRTCLTPRTTNKITFCPFCIAIMLAGLVKLLNQMEDPLTTTCLERYQIFVTPVVCKIT